MDYETVIFRILWNLRRGSDPFSADKKYLSSRWPGTVLLEEILQFSPFLTRMVSIEPWNLSKLSHPTGFAAQPGCEHLC